MRQKLSICMKRLAVWTMGLGATMLGFCISASSSMAKQGSCMKKAASLIVVKRAIILGGCITLDKEQDRTLQRQKSFLAKPVIWAIKMAVKYITS